MDFSTQDIPAHLLPSNKRDPIESIDNESLTQEDMISFISASVDQETLVGHNIRGYNDLIENGISKIMTQLFNIDKTIKNERTQTEVDRSCKSYQIKIHFHDVHVSRPTCTTYLTGQFTDLFPSRAKITGLPYSGAVSLGATVTVKASFSDDHVEEKVAEIPPFQIGGLPIMVGSSRCHTSNCTRETLKEMCEDPSDLGGFFILRRGEYVVDLSENIRYNSPHIHRKMITNELLRVEFLSQPGGAFENSSQSVLRYMVNGLITIEIRSIKYEKLRIPFYVIFRLFGMTSDKQITNTIVFDLEDESPITIHMLNILEKAFHLSDAIFAPLVHELDREKIVQLTSEKLAKYIGNRTTYQSNDNAIQYVNEDLLKNLDKVLLPHIGQTADFRIKKLRFIGLLIHKMLLVHLDILPPTDRDSFRNKRVHGAGVSLAKAFKTQVNSSVVIPIIKSIRRELKNNQWNSVTDKTLVDTFKNSLSTSDLNKSMEQSITSGNKTIMVKRTAKTNRVSSQALERKNPLNRISSLRDVVTQNAGNASKQTERAEKMRRTHGTYPGFICVSQSACTGEAVGMRKQLAMTASVCDAGDAYSLKKSLLEDPEVTELENIPSEVMLRKGLSRVFVNGDWIGVCINSNRLVSRYRKLRREKRIVNPFTTISWDPVTDEVDFWLDVGRLRRPLLIVDNNIEEYDAYRTSKTGGTEVNAVVVESNGIVDGLYLHGINNPVYLRMTSKWHKLPNGGEITDISRMNYKEYVSRGYALEEQIPQEVTDFIKKIGGSKKGNATAVPEVQFTQNIRLTKEHVSGIVRGTLTMDDLIDEGIAEYITPEEQENCLIAESIITLREHKHNAYMQYTHCDVEQAIFGLASHMSPFANHTQPARVTFETSQARQTGGWYTLNFPFKTDKNKFFQFYNEIPLVRTLTHKFIPANGINTMITYAVYTGDNQEDSAIFSQASVDRGLFYGVFFRYDMAELEKGELFCNPGVDTKNTKPNACYEKLVDGFIKVGSIVRHGDVLIGRVAKIPRNRLVPGDKFLYTDRSIVYRLHEPALVEMVLRPRGANDEVFGIVKLRFERPLRTGDKLSSRSGNKSIVAKLEQQSNMPFCEDGTTPDAIISTHCVCGDALISAYNGLSYPLSSLAEFGGTKLWGWSREDNSYIGSYHLRRMTRKISEVIKITLYDGRTLRCTPNHHVLIKSNGISASIAAGDLTPDMLMVMGPDHPQDIISNDEDGWRLSINRLNMGFSTTIERERSLAFARLAGLMCTSKSMRVHNTIDAEGIILDINTICGVLGTAHKIPNISIHDRLWEVSMSDAYPLISSIGLELFSEESCPKSMMREFLASFMGRFSRVPTVNGIKCAIQADKTRLVIQSILSRLIPTDDVTMEEDRLIIRGPSYGNIVGFRYNSQKSARMNLINPFLRRLSMYPNESTNAALFYENSGIGEVVIDPINPYGPFPMKVVSIESDGMEMTYDLSIPIARTFVANGITVFNSFPSRMTIGQLIETSQSNLCAQKGIISDGTAFLPVDHRDIAKQMHELGFRYNGKKRAYNGMTGEYFDLAIFIGFTVEQRLQKFVLDDEQFVAGSGPTDPITGQPMGGKSIQGGIRFGEMESWAASSHGSPMNLYEKWSMDSDGRVAYVCRSCGSFADYNEYENIYKCKRCDDLADICKIDSSKSAILFHEELAASNVRVQLGLKPREFEMKGRKNKQEGK